LKINPGYASAEYLGSEYSSGDTVNGIRHEDLTAMSFGDSSLGLVISSDVLEHIPDPYCAHRDIHRVLKAGGRHIFTVPYNGGPKDDVRALMENGQIRHLKEPQYHGDPIRKDGILVFVIFGREMIARLWEMGFLVVVHSIFAPLYGIPDGLVFEAIKN
jgi:SAM-dependent methyltransferase